MPASIVEFCLSMKLYRLFVLGLLIAGLQSAQAQTPPAAGEVKEKTPPPAKKAVAETKKAAKDEAKSESKKKRDWYPFHGTVESVNTTASTVTLHKEGGQRVLHMDGKSALSRIGKSATLSDLKAGDYAHGKLHKNTRDEEVITDAKFDTEAPKKEDLKKEAKKDAKKSTKKVKKAADKTAEKLPVEKPVTDPAPK